MVNEDEKEEKETGAKFKFPLFEFWRVRKRRVTDKSKLHLTILKGREAFIEKATEMFYRGNIIYGACRDCIFSYQFKAALSDASARNAKIKVIVPISLGNIESVKWLLNIRARVRDRDIGRLKLVLTEEEALVGIHDERGYYGYYFKSKDFCKFLRLAFDVMWGDDSDVSQDINEETLNSLVREDIL